MRVLRIFHSGPVDAWRERERALRERGHEVRLLSARRWNEGGSDVELSPRPGEDVVGVRTLGHHPALFVYDPRPLWKALGEHWDVVDVHEEPFSLAVAEVRLLRRMRGRRGALTLYSAQNIAKRYPFPFGTLERSALRAADGVSVCNAEAGRIVEAKGLRGRASLIPLGIDPAAFSPLGEPAPRRGVVGYVGRLEPHKGVATLVEAVAGHPDLVLEVAGAGPDEADLRERAAAAGQRIRFVGPLDQADLPAFYRSLDVLAVPSLDTPSWREQFGRVVVEALACGAPVVASDGGALPGVVGDAGLIVAQGDPAALRAALDRVVGDRELRAALSAAGPAVAESCGWDRVAADLEAMYVRAVGDTTARPVPAERSVEVVVVAYGRPDLLASALEPLRTLPVTVVDNSSDDLVREVSDRAGARYLDPGRNLGFGAGVNVALRAPLVPGSDVLLVNPDAVVAADVVEGLHKRLCADPRLAAVAPAQVDGAGRLSRVHWPFPTPARVWREAVGLGGGPGEYVIGSVLLLSRAALDDVGGFDEDFFLYAEETDWERRADARGWRLGYVPELVAEHLGSGTSTDPVRRELLFHAAQERYHRKHHGRLGWQSARAARVAGELARSVLARGDRSAEARRRVGTYAVGPQRALRRFEERAR